MGRIHRWGMLVAFLVIIGCAYLGVKMVFVEDKDVAVPGVTGMQLVDALNALQTLRRFGENGFRGPCRIVADDDQIVSSAGDGDIEEIGGHGRPAPLKASDLSGARAEHEDHHVGLLPLEGVHRVGAHGNAPQAHLRDEALREVGDASEG